MSQTLIQEVTLRRELAQESRKAGNHTTAGVYYTASAHGNIMRFRPAESNSQSIDSDDNSIEGAIPRWYSGLGQAVRDFLAAGLSFRLAAEPDRSRSCCHQAILFVRDLLQNEKNDIVNARIGLCHEMVGDLRVVGEIGDPPKAYDAAAEYYDSVDSDLGWSMEDDFDDVMHVLLTLADSVDYGIDKDTRERIYRTSLTDRIAYKKQHYPSIVDQVIAEGGWESSFL